MISIEYLLTIISLIILIKSKNQILITFNSIGNQSIYCDDIINYFETTNITIYRKLEENSINITNNLFIHNINVIDDAK